MRSARSRICRWSISIRTSAPSRSIAWSRRPRGCARRHGLHGVVEQRAAGRTRHFRNPSSERGRCERLVAHVRPWHPVTEDSGSWPGCWARPAHTSRAQAALSRFCRSTSKPGHLRAPGAGRSRQRRVAARPLGQLHQDRRRAARAGNLDAALKAYQESLAIAEKLAAQDPSNAEWQRDLSVSFSKIGDVQRAGQSRRRAQGLPGQPRHRREAGRAGPEQRRVAARPLGQLREDRRRAERAGQSRRRARGLSRTASPSARSWPRRTRATPVAARSRSATSGSATCGARGKLDDALKAYEDKLAHQGNCRAGPQQHRVAIRLSDQQ